MTSQTAIRSESCRSPDRVMLLADMKVLQRITDNLRDWLDEWKAKEPEAEAPMMWDGEPITAIKRTFVRHAEDCPAGLHPGDHSPLHGDDGTARKAASAEGAARRLAGP